MTLPKTPKDLALAPVAAEIDRNLQRLRDLDDDEGIDFELSLELDKPPFVHSRHERAARVLAVALRGVDLHGWNAEITEDAAAVRLTGGSVSLDISVGAAVRDYILGAAVSV